jgi:predicted nucleic acid-binding protein
VTKPIADLAASLRREYRWKLPDAFQAALAKHHELRLATRNTEDFPPEAHEFVSVPYAL